MNEDIHAFAKKGNVDGLKRLIEEGVDIDVQNKNGYTALMLASWDSNKSSNIETVQLLIQSGANLDIQNKNGYTALMIASRFSNTSSNLETVKLLIQSGANLDIQNKNGSTAISILKQKYDNSIVSEVLKSSPEYAVLNKRYRANISKTITYFDAIMQSEETVNIGEYIEEDKDNIVIVYNNNDYFMTTREIIQMQLDDATFSRAKLRIH